MLLTVENADGTKTALTAQQWEESPHNLANKSYTWVTVTGGQVRAKCTPCEQVMGWGLAISKDYPRTINKYTVSHHAHPVVFNGLLVQVWKCKGCGQQVVK